MPSIIKTEVSIQKAVFDQSKILAKKLDVSQTQLFEIAITYFIKNYQNQTLLAEPSPSDEIQSAPNKQDESPALDPKKANQILGKKREINQGDIYWVQLPDQSGLELGYPHPHVIIQDNVFNHSRINTVVVCALTSNRKRANLPGNISLEAGEANLSRQSIVVVSQISTVDKTQLGEYIGTLTEERINQIMAGLRFLQVSFFDR